MLSRCSWPGFQSQRPVAVADGVHAAGMDAGGNRAGCPRAGRRTRTERGCSATNGRDGGPHGARQRLATGFCGRRRNQTAR